MQINVSCPIWLVVTAENRIVWFRQWGAVVQGYRSPTG